MENDIYVTKPFLPPLEEYVEQLKKIWDTHILTNMGELHEELEAQLQRYLGVPYCLLFCNGHMALELLLQSMNLKGEVITTPFTFASTTHAIIRSGLIPVFCDISEKDYTMDETKIEELITEKTAAILPVHVYGNPCHVEEIEILAKKHGLKVIYDAAHAFGVEINGRGIGSYGDASMFSFHATKTFHTIEGGAVTCSDRELGVRLYQSKNFGFMGEDQVHAIGANAKMNEFQAAMGLCNLRHFSEITEKRKKVIALYREQLQDIDGIVLKEEREGVRYNHSYFPILIKDCYGNTRDMLYQKLRESHIYARRYFYPLTSAFQCYGTLYLPHKTPVAEYIADHILVLPLYDSLAEEDILRTCKIIRQVGRHGESKRMEI